MKPKAAPRAPATPAPPAPHPGAHMTRLSPLPTTEAQEAFWPLFTDRNACMILQGEVTEMMFAAIRRGDRPAEAQLRSKLEALQLHEQRLSREMRPHQFQDNGGEAK